MIPPIFIFFTAFILLLVLVFCYRVFLLVSTGSYNGWWVHIITNSLAAVLLIAIWFLVFFMVGVRA